MAGRVEQEMEASVLRRKVVWDLVRSVQGPSPRALEKLSYVFPSGLQEVPRGIRPKGLRN